MKVWELERTAKNIISIHHDEITLEYEPILAEYSRFDYDDHADIFPKDDAKAEDKNLMLASGVVEGRKQTYILLLVYRYGDRILHLALIGEDGVTEICDIPSRTWRKV